MTPNSCLSFPTRKRKPLGVFNTINTGFLETPILCFLFLFSIYTFGLKSTEMPHLLPPAWEDAALVLPWPRSRASTRGGVGAGPAVPVTL